MALHASYKRFFHPNVEQSFCESFYHSSICVHTFSYMVVMFTLCLNPLINPQIGHRHTATHMAICTCIMAGRGASHFYPGKYASCRRLLAVTCLLYVLYAIVKPPRYVPDLPGTPDNHLCFRVIVAFAHYANLSFITAILCGPIGPTAHVVPLLLLLAAVRGNLSAGLDCSTQVALALPACALGIGCSYTYQAVGRITHVVTSQNAKDSEAAHRLGLHPPTHPQTFVERRWVRRGPDFGDPYDAPGWEYAHHLKPPTGAADHDVRELLRRGLSSTSRTWAA